MLEPQTLRIREFAKVSSGTTPLRSEGSRFFCSRGHLWVKTGDLNNGSIYDTSEHLTDEAVTSAGCRIYPIGTVLVAMYGGFKQIGRTGILRRESAINQAISAIQPNTKIIYPEYLLHYLNSRVSSWKRFAASSRKDPNITRSDVEFFRVLVLPLPEQRRIAEILRTWDEAIEKLEALRAAKERRLHILREKLTYADVQHEPTRLGDVTEEVTTRNGAGILDRNKVMGVTNSRGIVPMREQTIAGDISRYKIVADQAFAYNPMRINVGSIARNQTGEDILVSPDYVAFACSLDGMLPDYLDHLRNTKWWAHYINSGGSGSVRQRTYYSDLAAMKVPLPKVAEQRRIADILNTAKRDAEATSREITALQRQKRGLMQKLLTGEWRVTAERS